MGHGEIVHGLEGPVLCNSELENLSKVILVATGDSKI